MYYLILTPLASTAILILFRIFNKLNINVLQAIILNYLVALLFGIFQETGFHSFAGVTTRPWFWLSLMFGFLLIVGFNLYARSTQKAGITITAMAGRLSLVIPVILGFLVFQEKVLILKVLGIILAVTSFYLTLFKENSGKPDLKKILLPVMLFVTSGCGDTILKTAQYYYISGDFNLFLTFAFLVAFLLSILQLISDRKNNRLKLHWQTVAGGVVLGTLNWYSTLFMLKGLDVYEVSTFLPVVNVSIVSLSALCGWFLFREKLSRINLLGVVLAVAAIVLLGR